MTGYGNRTAEAYMADNYVDQHNNTRLGVTASNIPYSSPHEKHGPDTTGGAGNGNKSSAFPSSSPQSFRFNSTHNTAPYSNATRMGSGSTAGAGYGNKTGSFNASRDSTVGRLMEKVGHAMHDEDLVEKGRVKRADKGFAGGE